MPADQRHCQRIRANGCSHVCPARSMVQLNEERIAPTTRFVQCQVTQERWASGLQQNQHHSMPKAHAPSPAPPKRWRDFAPLNRQRDFAHIMEQRSLRQNRVGMPHPLQRAKNSKGVSLF